MMINRSDYLVLVLSIGLSHLKTILGGVLSQN